MVDVSTSDQTTVGNLVYWRHIKRTMSLQQRISVVWHDGEQADVASEQALNVLLVRLQAEAEETMAFSIQVSVNTTTTLLVTLGGAESHMEFYDRDSRPPVIGCCGERDSDELITFLHSGQHTEMERRYCVIAEQALQALYLYIRTGKRPTNVQWNDFE